MAGKKKNGTAGNPPRKGKDAGRSGGGSSQGGSSGGNGSSSAQQWTALTTADVAATENALVNPAIQGLTEMSFSEQTKQGTITLPRRPGHGTQGLEVTLWANYFDIVPARNVVFHRYSVSVHSSRPSDLQDGQLKLAGRKMKRAFELFIETCPMFQTAPPTLVATDYRSIIITTKKVIIGEPHPVIYYERGEQTVNPSATSLEAIDSQGSANQWRPTIYTFRLAADDELSLDSLMEYLRSSRYGDSCETKLPLLQALNIVMARKPAMIETVTTTSKNQKFFSMVSKDFALKGGLVAVPGIFSSVRTSTGRLLLNVNTATGAFYKPGPLNAVIDEFEQTNGQNHYGTSRFLKGVRVGLPHLAKKKGIEHKTMTIFGLNLNKSYNARNVTVGDTPETVLQYFRRVYKISLREPDRRLVNLGNQANPVWMPAELCEVLRGQPSKRKLDATQTENMLSAAKHDPEPSRDIINTQGTEVLGLNDENANGPQQFGLHVIPRMLIVPARVLIPPKLLFDQHLKTKLDSYVGAWNLVNNEKVVKTVATTLWKYVVINQPNLARQLTDTVVRLLADRMAAHGIGKPLVTGRKEHLALNLANPDEVRKGLIKHFQFCLDEGAKAVVVILPDKDTRMYSHIKFIGDCEVGLHTVCCISEKLFKPGGQAQFLTNMALKVNLKRGGTNWQLERPMMGIVGQGKTMVVGIDVTHPSPGSIKLAPSIAGVVASVDGTCAQWLPSIRAQDSKVELVQQLTEMMCERLIAWERRNKSVLPSNILVYRDGVSEGQYDQVLLHESAAIDRAISAIYRPKDPKPKVSIIIVGKRHHTRFYPHHKDSKAINKGLNPRNGTVVDRAVTGERLWDFFLQSHHSGLGTARPAHYIVIKNDIPKMDVHALETITHNLCYLYGPATKAVSVCTPAYLADLLCERGRCYLYDAYNHVGNPDAEYDSTNPVWTHDVYERLQNTMYYI